MRRSAWPAGWDSRKHPGGAPAAGRRKRVSPRAGAPKRLQRLFGAALHIGENQTLYKQPLYNARPIHAGSGSSWPITAALAESRAKGHPGPTTLAEFIASPRQNKDKSQYGSPVAAPVACLARFLLDGRGSGSPPIHARGPYRGARPPTMQDTHAGPARYMAEQISTAVQQIRDARHREGACHPAGARTRVRCAAHKGSIGEEAGLGEFDCGCLGCGCAAAQHPGRQNVRQRSTRRPGEAIDNACWCARLYAGLGVSTSCRERRKAPESFSPNTSGPKSRNGPADSRRSGVERGMMLGSRPHCRSSREKSGGPSSF